MVIAPETWRNVRAWWCWPAQLSGGLGKNRFAYYERTKNGKVVYRDQWETAYGALIDDEGKKIPTPQVPVAEVDGTYLGPEF